MFTRRASSAMLLATGALPLLGHRSEAATRTRIVPFQTSPFPYDGLIPSSGLPFLDTLQDGQRAHTSPRGGVYPENPTYADRSVLLAVPPRFAPSRAVIVVYLHGNLARLDRDVVRRQRVVAQLAASKLDAVLVAPQFAVDALDSSAGHFWDSGGFAHFLDEAAAQLAAMTGQEPAVFAAMPVVLVAYSGGYHAAAGILAGGGTDNRILGLILLDALYGDEETFADWIVRTNGRTFFFSAFSTSSASSNQQLQSELVTRGIAWSDGLPPALAPGVVAFLAAGDVPHNDFVTSAWTADPLRAVLARIVVAA